MQADVEELARVVPLVQGAGGVEAFVALEPDEVGGEDRRERLGDLGLAAPRRPLDEEGLLQDLGQMERGGNGGVGHVRFAGELLEDVRDGFDHGGRIEARDYAGRQTAYGTHVVGTPPVSASRGAESAFAPAHCAKNIRRRRLPIAAGEVLSIRCRGAASCEKTCMARFSIQWIASCACLASHWRYTNERGVSKESPPSRGATGPSAGASTSETKDRPRGDRVRRLPRARPEALDPERDTAR